MLRNSNRLPSCLLGALLLACAAPAWAQAVPALTKPSGDVTLSFSRPGRIAEVLVKKEDAVKVGQVVVRQDSREEEASLAMDQAAADDMTEVQAQKAILEQKKVDLAKAQWAFDKGAKSQFELDDAKIQVVIADAQLKIANFKHEQAVRKAEQSKIIVNKMSLASPFDGTVEQILAHAGESAEFNTKVIRLVSNNPLWVEASVPTNRTANLARGNTAKVTFPDQAVLEGKIVSIGAVADPASDTLLVTVEIPNPTSRRTGQQVQVDFGPAKVAQANP